MKYWKLNEDRQLVALVDFWNVKAGDVGATIPVSCQLGSDEHPLWLGASVNISYQVKIGDWVKIGNDVNISMGVNIGDEVKIGNSVKIGVGVNIGNYVDIGEDVKIGCDVTIGHNALIGNNVIIGNWVNIGNKVTIGRDGRIGDDATISDYAKLADNAQIEQGEFIQFVSFGLNNRTILIYKIKDKTDPVISVGCQCGISFEEFKERIENNVGTSEESAKIYKEYMCVFENCYNRVKNS